MHRVNIIDFSINKKINDNWQVFNDDSSYNIFEKIFMFYKTENHEKEIDLWIPEFLKIEKLTNENGELNIYINHIVNEFKENNVDGGNIIYNNYKNKYNINEKYFNIIYNIYTQNESNVNEIINFVNEQNARKMNLLKKFEKVKYIYEEKLSNEQEEFLENMFNVEKQNKLMVLDIEHLYGQTENSSSSIINVSNLFNNFELDNVIYGLIIPGMYFKKENPIIKVSEILPEKFKKDNIKKWILNEKKKMEIMNYKKIRNIIFKCYYDDIFFDITLKKNGNILIKYSKENNKNIMDTKTYYSNINNIIFKLYTFFFSKINKNEEFFTNSDKKILFTNYIINFISLDITVSKLQRNYLKMVLNKKSMGEFFKLKDLKDDNIISMFYKKYKNYLDVNKLQFVVNNDELKGITVGIKDNPYKVESSIITILESFSIQQVKNIIKWIFIFHNRALKEYSLPLLKHILKQKNEIKELKKQGADIISTNCQKNRHPKISDTLKPKKNSYALMHNNKRYICDSDTYKYPGFTNKDIVCCFKTSQKHKHRFLMNVKEKDFFVEPSNYIIEIKYKNGVILQTFPLRHIENNIKMYYYINPFNSESSDPSKLAISKIENTENGQEIINKMEQIEKEYNINNKTIWLESVNVINLFEPKKNKCNNYPTITKKQISKFQENSKDYSLNYFCNKYKKTNFFGFTNSGIPCCFEKNKYYVNDIKKEELNIKHILKEDKDLDDNRFGELPEYINKIITSDKETKYVRMGNEYSPKSFINAIKKCLIHSNPDYLQNFDKIFIDNLKKNNLFNYAYNGELPFYYTSQDEFIKIYLNESMYIQEEHLMDLFMKIFNINIIILEINEQHNKFDYLNSKIICSISKFKNDNPYCIIFKKKFEKFDIPKFEMLANIPLKNVVNGKIKLLFNSHEKIVKYFKSFFDYSCQIFYNNITQEPINYIDLINFLKTNIPNFEIIYTKSDNIKIDLIILKIIESGDKKNGEYYYLPIKEMMFIDFIEISNFNNINLIKIKNLLKVNTLNYFDKFYKDMLNNFNIKIIGYIKTSHKYFDGLLLNTDQIIPIMKITQDLFTVFMKNNIDKSNKLFYPEIYYERLFNKTFASNIMNYDNYIELNIYNKEQKKLQKVKEKLYIMINTKSNNDNDNDLKNYIKKIIKETSDNAIKFRKILYKIYNSFLAEKEFLKQNFFYIKVIVMEILIDVNEHKFLNGIFSTDNIIKKYMIELIKKKNEFLITNLQELNKFLQH